MRACRTCLSKYDLCPLFGENEFSSEQLFLSTGVRMAPDDGLPQTVCRSCIKTITKSLQLRELSSKAEEFLRTIAEHNVKTEPNIQDVIESLIDPFSIENHENSHIFIQQNEQRNDINEFNDDDYPSDDDTKPVIGNDDMKDDDFDIDNEHTYKTEFVNIQTKQEHEYDIDNERKTMNCITLSKDAQIMLYPTKDGGHNSKALNITKESDEHMLQTQTVGLCKSLKTKTTKDPTNMKYITKRNTDTIQNFKSETGQSILKNKLQNDSANILGQPATLSGQPATESGLPATVSGQPATVSGQTSNIRIENFISNKEMNELFKDAYKFCIKVDASCQTVVDTFGMSSQIENTEDHLTKESHKLFNDRESFNEIKTVKRLNITNSFGLKIPVKYQKIPEDGQDHEKLFGSLMSNLKNNLPKYIPNDAQECSVIKNKYNIKKPKKMDMARRKFFQERNKELMALAVLPYKETGPIQCSVCYEMARNKQRFRNHALKHFDKQHVCQYAGCGKKFVHRSQLSRHQQCMHGVEKRFSCGQCAFRAVDRPTIQNHIRAEHTGEKPFECNECGARFRMRNNLIQHMIVHFRPTKSVQCEYCPSRFQCRRDLWIHQDKTHFYTYNYYCYLCPNVYKGGCSVRKHLLKVHGVPKDQQLKIRRDKIRKTDAPSSSHIKPIVSNTPR